MLKILTLHWNKRDSLVRLKDTLLPSLKNIEYHWLIKDNNSSDGSYEEASKWGEHITCIKYPNNSQNFSEGMNFLFNEAKTTKDDLILLLNNDVSFTDDQSIHKMINLLTDNVGIVGAKLLYTGTNKIQHCGVVFTEDRTKQGSPSMPIHLKRGQEANEDTDKNRYFQACTGAVMLLRASDMHTIGGFDNNLKWAFDDIDLSLNINKTLKKKIVMCGSTKIFHDESASLKVNPVNKLYLQQNITYFLKKWHGKYQSDVMKYLTNSNHNLYVKQ